MFSPSPLYTITVEQGGEEPEVHFHAGGQGFWVARMATVLGARTTLCGPFGGEPGRVLRPLIEAEQVEVRAVECVEVNGGYIHDRRGGERHVIVEVKSGQLSRHEVDDLYAAALTCGLASRVTVLTGPTHDSVIPVDVYRRLARDLDAHGGRVVADVSGATFGALEGGVQLLKVSHEELMDAGLAASDRTQDIVVAMQRLRASGMRDIVVSRAAAPALALFEERLLEVTAPRFEAREHRGAGDSMTAALSVGLASDLAPEPMLQLAAAAGALNVTRHGLGTGKRSDIEDMAKRVVVEPL